MGLQIAENLRYNSFVNTEGIIHILNWYLKLFYPGLPHTNLPIDLFMEHGNLKYKTGLAHSGGLCTL